MAKKVNGGISTKQAKAIKREKSWRQWTSSAPYAETEYPFGYAIVEEDSENSVIQHQGPGIRLYKSTICLCRRDTLDSMLLTQLGEQFRKFFPGEMPWIEKTKHALCEDIWEEDEVPVEDSLRYLATQGFLDLDTSVPGLYRYRLNVAAVRQAKNRYFRPMNDTERIITLYRERFPEYRMQHQAFLLVCDQDDLAARLLERIWDRSLENASFFTGGHAEWVAAHVPPDEEREQCLETMHTLQEKGLLEKRVGRLAHFEYRPNVSYVWALLAKLPPS